MGPLYLSQIAEVQLTYLFSCTKGSILIVSAVTLLAGCGILKPIPDYYDGPKDLFDRMERKSP